MLNGFKKCFTEMLYWKIRKVFLFFSSAWLEKTQMSWWTSYDAYLIFLFVRKRIDKFVNTSTAPPIFDSDSLHHQLDMLLQFAFFYHGTWSHSYIFFYSISSMSIDRVQVMNSIGLVYRLLVKTILRYEIAIAIDNIVIKK